MQPLKELVHTVADDPALTFVTMIFTFVAFVVLVVAMSITTVQCVDVATKNLARQEGQQP